MVSKFLSDQYSFSRYKMTHNIKSKSRVFDCSTMNTTEIQNGQPVGQSSTKPAQFMYTSCYDMIRTEILNWGCNAGHARAGFSGGNMSKYNGPGVWCCKTD
jgi:hypothetical protein